jgi:hypothetical protein
VNPTVETDAPGTTGLDVLERLYRYITGQLMCVSPEHAWDGVERYVDYAVGIGEKYLCLDGKKTYIPFSESEIEAKTEGKVSGVGVDLEEKKATRKQKKDYSGYDESFGFYSAEMLKYLVIMLIGLKQAGYHIQGGRLTALGEGESGLQSDNDGGDQEVETYLRRGPLRLQSFIEQKVPARELKPNWGITVKLLLNILGKTTGSRIGVNEILGSIVRSSGLAKSDKEDLRSHVLIENEPVPLVDLVGEYPEVIIGKKIKRIQEERGLTTVKYPFYIKCLFLRGEPLIWVGLREFKGDPVQKAGSLCWMGNCRLLKLLLRKWWKSLSV